MAPVIFGRTQLSSVPSSQLHYETFEYSKSGEVDATKPDINFPNYFNHPLNENADLSSFVQPDLSSNSLPSWQIMGFQDQILRHQDGFSFNLSSIDWDSVNVYYAYESSNDTELPHNDIPVGRAVALGAFIFMFLVGLLGNLMVVISVARCTTLRRATHIYLLNLSAANLLYLLLCLPALSASYALVDWRFGDVFCKVENYAMSVSVSVSIWTILAAGLDHYLAVIAPQGTRTFRTTTKTLSVICFIWIMSFVAMAPRIPIFSQTSVFHLVGTKTLCSRVASSHILKIDTALNFLCLYLLPLLALGICLTVLIRKTWKNACAEMVQDGQAKKIGAREAGRTTKLLIAVSVLFGIGWLPTHVYHLFEDFDEGNILFGQFIDRGTTTLLFSFSANSFNPVFFYIFSKSLRKCFRKSLKCGSYERTTANRMNSVGSARGNVKLSLKQTYSRTASLLPGPESRLLDKQPSASTQSSALLHHHHQVLQEESGRID